MEELEESNGGAFFFQGAVSPGPTDPHHLSSGEPNSELTAPVLGLANSGSQSPPPGMPPLGVLPLEYHYRQISEDPTLHTCLESQSGLLLNANQTFKVGQAATPVSLLPYTWESCVMQEI